IGLVFKGAIEIDRIVQAAYEFEFAVVGQQLHGESQNRRTVRLHREIAEPGGAGIQIAECGPAVERAAPAGALRSLHSIIPPGPERRECFAVPGEDLARLDDTVLEDG